MSPAYTGSLLHRLIFSSSLVFSTRLDAFICTVPDLTGNFMHSAEIIDFYLSVSIWRGLIKEINAGGNIGDPTSWVMQMY
jgi:hypothetical protein